MKAIQKIIIIILVLAGLIGGGFYWFQRTHAGSSGNSIRVSGNIEVTSAEISFKIPGRVLERLVDEGQRVKKGNVIAKLDDAELKIDVNLRKAELTAAQAALAELEAGSRPEEIASAKAAMDRAKFALDDLEAGARPQEIASAKATLDAALAEKNRATSDYNRFKQLYESRTISAEQYDSSKSAFEVATERVRDAQQKYELIKAGNRVQQIEQARAAYEQAASQYLLIKAGPRKEMIDQARAKVEQVAAALNGAETRLSYAVVYSPMDGIVLSKNIEPGEYVSAGTPVVTVGDIINVWLRAYIQATDLGKINVAQTAKITTDTYPGKIYEGRVAFISPVAEFTPKNVQTEKERVKLVYRIKIDITNPNMELKPGMPADAEIVLDPESTH